MAFGLGVLRLAPDDFWTMTPRELHAAFGGLYPEVNDAPLRASLAAMLSEFPDTQGNDNE